MLILSDVGIGLEINVLTSKFILLGYQMLGEMGCHPEICFYNINQKQQNMYQLAFGQSQSWCYNQLLIYSISILLLGCTQT